jgi:hypothetical protein
MNPTHSTRNCPFYGRALFSHMILPVKFILLDTKSNQCAIVTDKHSPCLLELNHEDVEWRDCPLIKDIRLEQS